MPAQVRAVGGKLQAIDDHPRAIGSQNALQPERLDRQRADASLWQIDHPVLGREIELNRRWLPLEEMALWALPLSARRMPESGRSGAKSANSAGSRFSKARVDADRVLARLVAC